MGPSPNESLNGYCYYIPFIDHHSRSTWIYLLHNKSEAFQTFLNFKTKVELQTGHKVKAIQTDWVVSIHFLSRLSGIEYRVSCPHAHQQNGLVECKHMHIVETWLTLLARASMHIDLWDEAFRTVVFLINRLQHMFYMESVQCKCYTNLHRTTSL